MLAVNGVSQADIGHIADDMDRGGIGIIPGFLTTDQLQELRDFVSAAVEAAQGGYTGLAAAQLGHTVLGDIGRSPVFLNILRQVFEHGVGRPAPDQSIYQILRCLRGPSGLKNSLIFHYDSYVVTALLPICIPQGPQAGHLLLAPNARPFRSRYLWNLIDKLLLDNKLTQWALKNYFLPRRGIFKEIVLVPGNLYLFWGYRAIHANAACDPDKTRATALFHFGDPHAGSRLRKFTGKASERAAPLPGRLRPDSLALGEPSSPT